MALKLPSLKIAASPPEAGGAATGAPMPIEKPSQDPSAPPFANTAPPPPFSAESQLPLLACKPTTSPLLTVPGPACRTSLKVSHPRWLLLPAFTLPPPPFSAWKNCPLPAWIKTLSPLSSEPPFASTSENVSQPCATVAVASTAPPPLFCAPMNVPRTVVRRLTLLTVLGPLGGMLGGVTGGEVTGFAASPLMRSCSHEPSAPP